MTEPVVYALKNTGTNAFRLSGGLIRTFLTESEARVYRNDTLSFPNQWEVIALPNTYWRAVARHNYISGEFIATPWHSERFHLPIMEELGLYPRVGAKDKTLVDYFPPNKGEKGVTQSTKPGKFLKSFYGDVLSDEQIKEWSDKYVELYSPAKVKWAWTPDEIEEVYSMPAGFTSCMQHRRSHWRHGTHPTRAYGAGDLAIAYLTRDRTLVARALVWPEKKKVGRVYGEGNALRAALRAEGIPTESTNSYYDSMEGARMLYIPHSPLRAVLPYIDSRDNTYGLSPDKDDETKLVLGKYTFAKYQAIDQGGLIHETPKCGNCDNYNARVEGITNPGYHFGALLGQYKGRLCDRCNTGNEMFVDASTGYRFSTAHYTPVRFFTYSNEVVSNYAQYLVKEALDPVSYFISDVSGHAFRNREKVVVEGKTMSTYERDTQYFQSAYDGVFYDKRTTRSGMRNGLHYTEEQLAAVIASQHDLFLRPVGA